MGWISGPVVYLLIWWVTLFAVLPWGNTPADRPGPGHATSAPANPRIKLKFIATSIVAAVIWLIIYVLMKMDIISFHDMADRMMREDGFQ